MSNKLLELRMKYLILFSPLWCARKLNVREILLHEKEIGDILIREKIAMT